MCRVQKEIHTNSQVAKNGCILTHGGVMSVATYGIGQITATTNHELAVEVIGRSLATILIDYHICTITIKVVNYIKLTLDLCCNPLMYNRCIIQCI